MPTASHALPLLQPQTATATRDVGARSRPRDRDHSATGRPIATMLTVAAALSCLWHDSPATELGAPVFQWQSTAPDNLCARVRQGDDHIVFLNCHPTLHTADLAVIRTWGAAPAPCDRRRLPDLVVDVGGRGYAPGDVLELELTAAPPPPQPPPHGDRGASRKRQGGRRRAAPPGALAVAVAAIKAGGCASTVSAARAVGDAAGGAPYQLGSVYTDTSRGLTVTVKSVKRTRQRRHAWAEGRVVAIDSLTPEWMSGAAAAAVWHGRQLRCRCAACISSNQPLQVEEVYSARSIQHGQVGFC